MLADVLMLANTSQQSGVEQIAGKSRWEFRILLQIRYYKIKASHQQMGWGHWEIFDIAEMNSTPSEHPKHVRF